MVSTDKMALFLDPGYGKTVITLSALVALKMRTLIVAPLDVIYRVWPNEIAKWDHTNKIKWTILHGPNKDVNFRQNAGIYLINPEGLRWLVQRIRVLKRWPFRILVVDESTIFKSPTSKRFTEHLGPMISNFERRYILTGTPIPRSYIDLWSQFYILDQGKRLTNEFYHYRNKYFYESKYGWGWELFPGSEEKIQEAVADVTERVQSTTCFGEPEVRFNDIKVKLPPNARAWYQEMAKELVIEFDDGKVASAANAAVKSNKLQCISNGFIYISEMSLKTGKNEVVETKNLHTAKVDALESIITELNGNPILVGYHYKQDLILLRERFPKAPAFGGGASQAEKIKIEKEWNAGNIPVLLAQITATSKGLNLQHGGYHLALFSLIWNFETYDQFLKRIARQGQKSSVVTVHRLIAEHTVDDLIVARLADRKQTSDQFLKAIYDHAHRSVSSDWA